MTTLQDAAALGRKESGLAVVSTLRADGTRLDAEGLRLLLRNVFTSAGGQHDDWDEYDRVMAQHRRPGRTDPGLRELNDALPQGRQPSSRR